VLPTLHRALAEGPKCAADCHPWRGKNDAGAAGLARCALLGGKRLLMLDRGGSQPALRPIAWPPRWMNRRRNGRLSHEARHEGRTQNQNRSGHGRHSRRLLQQDPALSEYAIVLFDEFHERSLQADTGWPSAFETQRAFPSGPPSARRCRHVGLWAGLRPVGAMLPSLPAKARCFP